MADLALVTGACSGIGLEIARELARRGHPLLLVSNRAEPLEAAAKELAAAHGVACSTFTVDLARPDAAQLVIDEVQRRQLEVGIFVNNAGIFFFGLVADADPVKVQALLQLHVVTSSLLVQHFAREMRTRRRGHILVVSSISAWNDFPSIALYGASKLYLRSFARALRFELEPYGVNVTCVAPGATATNLYSQTGVPVAVAVKFRVMRDAAGVARDAVNAMFKRKALVLPGIGAKLMAWGMALAPGWLIGLIRRHSKLLPMP